MDEVTSETATASSTSTHYTIFSKKPEMFDLTKIVIPKIMNEWEYIAETLRYDLATIKAIKDKERGDPKKCCRDFFKDWLMTNNGARAGPKVWSTLLNVLKEVDEISADVTEDIIAEVKQLRYLPQDLEEMNQNMTEKMNQNMINFMRDARKNNKTVEVRFGRVLFSGSSGAGKTSFYKLLMNRKRFKQHISTGLAESEQVIAVVKVDMHSQDKHVVLSELDIEKEISKLHSLLDTMASTESSKGKIPAVPKASSEESKPLNVEIQIARKRPPYDIPKIKVIRETEADDKIMNVFTFMDTGGQPQFISMIPAVNSSAMVTFVVHNVAKSLDDKVTVTHGDSLGNPTFFPYTTDCTNAELIKSLISFSNNSMLRKKPFLEGICKNTTKNNISYLSFIGSHIDESSTDENSEHTIRKIDDSLGTMVADAGIKHVWRKIHPDYKYLIPVNSLALEGDNKYGTYDSVEKIRKKLYNKILEQEIYNVPIVWLLLELEIRKKCEKQSFIPYPEIVKLCGEHNLIEKEEDIKNGLRFFHLFGVLLFFDEVPQLCDYVFTDHQWLFNNLTEIVYQSYLNEDQDDTDIVEDFEQKGFFTESMLDKCNLKLKYQNESLQEKDFKEGFIELLKYLRIIAPLTKKDKSVVYFMPSLLSTCNFGNDQHNIPNKYMPENTVMCDKAEPLLVQFKLKKNTDRCGSFPRGTFTCLIVELLQDASTWDIHWLRNRKRVFENLVTLLYKESLYVTLVDKIFYLEVIILQEKDNNSNLMHFYKIKQALNTALEQIGSKLNFERFVLTYGFICYDCLITGEHRFLEETSPDALTCCYKHKKEKTDKYTIWNKEIGESQLEDPTVTGTNKPTLKSLMKYRNSIAPIWHNLGIQLLPVGHTAKLGVIQADNHNKVEDCCDKMFQHWFAVDTEANWNKLIDALESIDQNALAATIREDILRGHPVKLQQSSSEPQQQSAEPQQQSGECKPPPVVDSNNSESPNQTDHEYGHLSNNTKSVSSPIASQYINYTSSQTTKQKGHKQKKIRRSRSSSRNRRYRSTQQRSRSREPRSSSKNRRSSSLGWRCTLRKRKSRSPRRNSRERRSRSRVRRCQSKEKISWEDSRERKFQSWQRSAMERRSRYREKRSQSRETITRSRSRRSYSSKRKSRERRSRFRKSQSKEVRTTSRSRSRSYSSERDSRERRLQCRESLSRYSKSRSRSIESRPSTKETYRFDERQRSSKEKSKSRECFSSSRSKKRSIGSGYAKNPHSSVS